MERIGHISFGSFQIHQKEFCGVIINTTKQTILIGIDNCHRCCENYGSFAVKNEAHIDTNDDLREFVNANLLDIKVVDTSNSVIALDYLKDEKVHLDSAMFVNIYTSNGVLQFVMYNEHNGFYGHSITILSKQLSLSKTL